MLYVFIHPIHALHVPKETAMATGRLVVTGTIDLTQFWPVGQSDADTTKILLDVSADAFTFQAHPGVAPRHTEVFVGAKIKGAQGNVKPAIDPNGRVTVRLQGIDAPELHYRPQSALKDPPKKPVHGIRYRTPAQKQLYLELNEDYRQPMGETATVALRDHLLGRHADPLPCEVVSAVDSPNEVFDTYGRLVGDIIVGHNQENINHWLIRNGWALPAFYSSMNNDEILRLISLAAEARTGHRGIWSYYDAHIGSFTWQWIYRRPTKGHPVTPAHAKDTAPVIVPKLFRRLATWAVNRKATMVSGPFQKYLEAQAEDRAMVTSEFLTQGPTASTQYPLASFIRAGKLTVDPGELVIKEKKSTVIPAPGKKVAWF
jgi:endonuclease YncB( thermonuclease family)